MYVYKISDTAWNSDGEGSPKFLDETNSEEQSDALE